MQLGQGEAAVELTRSQVGVTSYFVPSGTTKAGAMQQQAMSKAGERRREAGERRELGRKEEVRAQAITLEGSSRYHFQHRGG